MLIYDVVGRRRFEALPYPGVDAEDRGVDGKVSCSLT